MLVGEMVFHGHAKLLRHADEIERHEDEAAAGFVFEGERLGMEVLHDLLRRAFARGVAGHPDGFRGGDVFHGDTRFPVKGIAISGNLMQLFNNVDGKGNDLTFYGPFGSPTLRVSELNIAGS